MEPEKTDFPESTKKFHKLFGRILKIDKLAFDHDYQFKISACRLFLDTFLANSKDSSYNYNNCPKSTQRFLELLDSTQAVILTNQEDSYVIDYLFFNFSLFIKEKSLLNKLDETELAIYLYYKSIPPLSEHDKHFIPKYDNAFTSIDEYKCFEQTWNNRLQTIYQKFDDIKNDINYLGLANAFLGLEGAKNTELKRYTWQMKIFGFLLLTPPATLVLWVFFAEDNDFTKYYLHSIPLAAIELILIYFFRIVLKLYLNTKSQILQLKFRHNVCAFVHEYDGLKNDSSKIISDNFEKLIFSPIAPSDEKIPATFDGIEQFAKLIKECKTK